MSVDDSKEARKKITTVVTNFGEQAPASAGVPTAAPLLRRGVRRGTIHESTPKARILLAIGFFEAATTLQRCSVGGEAGLGTIAIHPENDAVLRNTLTIAAPKLSLLSIDEMPTNTLEVVPL